jgi:phosphoglycerate dehydrogenase-like enzyme
MNQTSFSRRTFMTGAGTASVAAVGSRRPVTASPFPVENPSPTSGADPIRIATRYRFSPDEIRTISTAAGDTAVELLVCDDAETFGAELAEAEVVYGRVPGEDLARAPRLRWVQHGAAGVDFLMSDEAFRNSPVVLTNQARSYAPGITETAMGLLLCLTRGITKYYMPMFYERRLRTVGTPASDHHIELAGKTMGIVGMGGIGASLARRAYYGFDMRVVGTDTKPLPKPEYVAELREAEWFPEMVPQVDVLVAAAPLTPETVRMFDESVFRSMRSTAYFIALSRGELFDDMALVRALGEGWIAGAGLDVFPQEPPPEDHPIYDAPNVVMTPHTSGWSPDRQTRMVGLFAENIRRYASGLPLLNVVDKQRMY